MATISNKETALLGLLSEGPMHAYKIEQEVKNRSMREWTEISMSSIYKLLRKLEKGKLVKSDIKLSKKNLSQKVYSITSNGKKELKQKIKDLLSEPEHMIYRVDLATSWLNSLTKNEALEYLEKYKTKLEEGFNCYQELEKYLIGCGCPKHKLALSQRPQFLFKGELLWVKQYLHEVKTSKELK